MKTARFLARAARGLSIAAALLSLAPAVQGQSAPRRLSDWLLEQPAAPGAYPLGLSWRVPEEEAAQKLLQESLLNALSGFDRELRADPAALERLRTWIGSLPVTGRVPVPSADARWLQANPNRDPILDTHHKVMLPARPRTVTLVTERGERCQIAHAPGLDLLGYVQACVLEPSRVDWVWIAQPDGRAQRFGVASWNRERADEAAPGAWIWAPARGAGWPERFSERLIGFLATQGPAADEADVSSVVSRRSTAARAAQSPAGLERLDEAVTASAWGGIGLLQTPTARMARAGRLSFNLSRTDPYTRGNVFVQPFDWMEAGFRYSDIANRPYGPFELSGDQTFKDKSLEVKFRLWKESAYLPELAIGARDISGTGLFSGEYVVANKRTGNFDWSLGLGWGYVGARGNLRNPLGRIVSRFDTRGANVVGQGGQLTTATFFTGPTALFGGVQYQTPWESLILKAEYDGNDYQKEPLDNAQVQRSPWNFGLVYRPARWADLTLGFERGNTLALGLAVHSQLNELFVPKVSDPPRIPVAAQRPRGSPDWQATSREIERQSGWHVGRIEQRGNELRVQLEDAAAIYWGERIERIASVLHRDAPADVERFVLVVRERGIDMAEHVVHRDAWLSEKIQLLPPGERRVAVIAREPAKGASNALYERRLPRFEHGLSVDYRQTLGGPDGFVLYQISAVERAKLRFRDDTWIQGAVRLGLIDNYDKFKFTAPSNLPRVRTFLREYLTTSKVQMANLQFTHVGKVTDNQYYNVYGGYLEEMFAGVGAEWLYRRFDSRTAFGVDVNAVQQRAFEQDFALRDYRVLTGHATLYWDTGWQDVRATISAGRYLAKDFGATLDLSRTFQNGVSIGAFATKTNVSAEKFGEGSFDKGVYVSIPFDAIMTRTTNIVGNFIWKPLTRDGGARLARQAWLYDITGPKDERTLWYKPAPPPNEAVIPADRRENWQPAPEGPAPYVRMPAKVRAKEWSAPEDVVRAKEGGAREDHAYKLTEALYAQEFRNIRVNFDASYRLNLALSNKEIRPISRAVGRAARTALRLSPLETREIRITFADGTEPLVTYEFTDALKLQRYLEGRITRQEFAETVAVHTIDPGAKQTDPLARLNDLQTEQEPKTLAALASLVTEPPRQVNRVVDDFRHVGRKALDVSWGRAGLITASAVLSSSFFDRRAFRFADQHQDNRFLKGVVTAGDWLPWMGLGASALLALDGSNPARSRTAYAATEAGASAFLLGTGLKYVFGRARPDSGLGHREFAFFSADDAHQSFPSRHTLVAWAVATPFAKEYGAPWLYGAAALTNLARIGSREHWVSDTVGSALLGYGLGELFWRSSRERSASAPRVLLTPSSVNMAWRF